MILLNLYYLQTYMFIMQWMLTARKRKIFSLMFASDILWPQVQGKRYGLSARLYSKVEYIWFASSGELTQQSTLFRFTYMIDTLRTMGWIDWLMSAMEWAAGGKLAGNVCVRSIRQKTSCIRYSPTTVNSSGRWSCGLLAISAAFLPCWHNVI